MAIEIKNRLRVGVGELNSVLKDYRIQTNNQGEVDILFTEPVERIDIVFIAGLFLLYQDVYPF